MIHEYQVVTRQNGVGDFVLEINLCSSDVGKYVKYFNSATDTWKLMRCVKWCYNLVRCSKATSGISYSNLATVYKHSILPVITYTAEAWHSLISKRAKNKLQQIQRSFLIFLTKAYRSVSLDTLQAIAGLMPIEQAVSLYKDIRAISRGKQTNAVRAQLRKVETPIKTKGTHPIDSYLHVELTGVEGIAEVTVYIDGSKTEHVGAGMAAVKDSKEIHTETQRLNNECTVFQAELCGIRIAIDWIQNQWKKASTYAINVGSKAALLTIANKHTTHPLAVDTRRKTIVLRKDTSVTFHWVKGHSGLKGNERADYLAKTVASYKPATSYDAIPVSRGKRLLEEYYIKIWNAAYTNSEKASHTKSLIPSTLHRMTLTFWPNHILTQFLKNYGCFRSYFYKSKKTPTPLCSCPEKAEQTARHLITDCSLFSKERPAVFWKLPLPSP